MRLICLLISILFCLGSGQFLRAQSAKELRKAQAREHFETLQSGALLVRLQTKSRSIEALRSVGKNQEADDLENEVAVTNKQIIAAFGALYELGPVFFFYSDDSRYILSGQLDSVTFLRDDLTPMMEKTPRFDRFLVAEFNHVESGQSETSNVQFRFPALVFRDAKLKQLERPFPYYSRTFSDIGFLERSPYMTVKRWFEKLEDYTDMNN